MDNNGFPIMALMTIIMLIIIIFVILPIPARIARGKGYSYWGFIVFAFFFWPIALIVSLLIENKMAYKSETDKAEALVKYKKLLDEGAITQEEYATLAAEISTTESALNDLQSAAEGSSSGLEDAGDAAEDACQRQWP